MNIRQRLRLLERELISKPATLFFEDGSSVQINGRGDYILELAAKAVRGESSREIELIRRSINSEELGGAHLLDLVRIFLIGPVEAQETTYQP